MNTGELGPTCANCGREDGHGEPDCASTLAARRVNELRSIESLPEVERISVARLMPSDVIVVESNELLSLAVRAQLELVMRQVWPDHRVVVCDRNLRLKVVREAAVEGGEGGGNL